MTQAQHPWHYQLEDLVHLREHATTGTRPLYRVDGLRLTHLRNRDSFVEIGLSRHGKEPGVLVWHREDELLRLVPRSPKENV